MPRTRIDSTIIVGDTVRSYDFAPHRRDCYVEGTVEGFLDPAGPDTPPQLRDCRRYIVLVARDVWCGMAQEDGRKGTLVFPPLNGTPTWDGETCFVERLD